MIDSKGLLKEFKERGFEGNIIGNIKAALDNNSAIYIGTDPSSIKEENRNPKYPNITSSLHVGHLSAFMAAKFFEKYGVKVIVLVGGCTAKMGDPSGKTSDRALLSYDEIENNANCIKSQLNKMFDFNSGKENAPIIVNNNDWMDEYSFVDFIRNVGKYLTVNYLMAKDSIKMRFEREGNGISVLEFLYQLVQAYDFVHLREKYNCRIQLAGFDQIGNASSGIELGRKSKGYTDMGGYFIPLVCDSNGNKFGKSENGKAVFLDPHLTSPYDFYQFWLNQSDEMAESLIKKFTMIELDEIYSLIEKHKDNPSERLLQKTLAKYMTIMIHSEDEYNKAIEASNILFGKGTKEQLETIDEDTLLGVMSGVNKTEISHDEIKNGINVIEIALKHDKIPSKGEARKLIKGNGFSINKVKITDDKSVITESDLIGGKYLLLQKGKKDYTLAVVK
jgi:tyrosyl-tRNA synthetase